MKEFVYSEAIRSRISMCVEDTEGMITQLPTSGLELVQTDVW